MTTVPAPTQNRLASLDVLRGVAVLGILLANLAYFGGPFNKFLSGLTPDASTLERWVDALSVTFVNSKFRGMLAILFGAGLYMQFRRLEASGQWPGTYAKRMLWLAALGAVHGVFIWLGDILFMYALAGLVTIPFVKLRGKVLVVTGVGLAAVLFLVCALLAAFVAFQGAGAISGGGSGLGAIDWLFSAAYETRVFQNGTYLQQLGFRAAFWALQLTGILFYLPLVLPLFFAGVLMARRGVFDLSRPDDGTRRRLMLWGLGLGLPLNALCALGAFAPVPLDLSLLVEGGLGMILAVGYIGLGLWLVQSRPGTVLRESLSRVGQVSLSSYLLQSLLGTFVFYSWGLGWFGRLSQPEMLLVALPIWAVVVAFAWFWTARFDIGPFEWAWRSLAAGRKLPWRRAAIPEAPPSPTV